MTTPLLAARRAHIWFSCHRAALSDDLADERGDVAPRTVGIAVMAALAISVGVIITAKVKARAEGINL